MNIRPHIEALNGLSDAKTKDVDKFRTLSALMGLMGELEGASDIPDEDWLAIKAELRVVALQGLCAVVGSTISK